MGRLAEFDSVTLTTFRDVPWNMPSYDRLGFRVIPGAKLSAALRAIVEDDTRRGRRGLDHRSIFLEKIPS